MLKKGLYVSKDDSFLDPREKYEITVDVNESLYSLVLTLIDLESKYGATQIRDMFANSKKVIIQKPGGLHGFVIWNEQSFTLYPFRVGVPFTFDLKDGV